MWINYSQEEARESGILNEMRILKNYLTLIFYNNQNWYVLSPRPHCKPLSKGRRQIQENWNHCHKIQEMNTLVFIIQYVTITLYKTTLFSFMQKSLLCLYHMISWKWYNVLVNYQHKVAHGCDNVEWD